MKSSVFIDAGFVGGRTCSQLFQHEHGAGGEAIAGLHCACARSVSKGAGTFLPSGHDRLSKKSQTGSKAE